MTSAQLLRLGVAELYLNGLLAAVLAAGVGRHTVGVIGKAPAGLAAGDLDLYDLRAVVCEIGADDGAGGVGGEVKDFDALKYFHVFSSSRCFLRPLRRWAPEGRMFAVIALRRWWRPTW